MGVSILRFHCWESYLVVLGNCISRCKEVNDSAGWCIRMRRRHGMHKPRKCKSWWLQSCSSTHEDVLWQCWGQRVKKYKIQPLDGSDRILCAHGVLGLVGSITRASGFSSFVKGLLRVYCNWLLQGPEGLKN